MVLLGLSKALPKAGRSPFRRAAYAMPASVIQARAAAALIPEVGVQVPHDSAATWSHEERAAALVDQD